MSDQAQALRNLVLKGSNETNIRPDFTSTSDRQTRIITVTSGKGGVGKSNFTLNFALALQARGYQVLVFDADIGMANIDVLMGASPKYNLYHLLKHERTIEEIIFRGVNDLQFIPGGSGFNDLLSLSKPELDYFTQQVYSLNGKVDFILFDTGAGLSKESMTFIAAAEQTIVVTTPEPTSITDAYAIIKMVHAAEPNVRFQLIVNRATDRKEGKQTADKIRMVAQQFLQLDIPTLGFLPDDANVSKAVKRQIPFSVLFPDSAASRELQELVERFTSDRTLDQEAASERGVKRFLTRMLHLLK